MKKYLINPDQEKEMGTHSSILAWKNPWTEESGGLKSMGLHNWSCVHEGGGRWVGSKKLVELKKKKGSIKMKKKKTQIKGHVTKQLTQTLQNHQCHNTKTEELLQMNEG